MAAMTELKQYIEEHCGIHVKHSIEVRLIEIVNQALIDQTFGCTEDYIEAVKNNHELRENLINALTINETYFFREVNQIHFFIESILPRLMINVNKPIRILSAGCSTGEEPYTWAIFLHEYLKNTPYEFEIDAGDIDENALNVAKRARYTRLSLRSLNQDQIGKYFHQEQKHFVLDEKFRNKVNFTSLNLRKNILDQGFADYDLVLYKNVSIYFEKSTREKVLYNLAQTLKPHAYLFVSHCEVQGNNFGILQLQSQSGIYYFQNSPSVSNVIPTGMNIPQLQTLHFDTHSSISDSQQIIISIDNDASKVQKDSLDNDGSDVQKDFDTNVVLHEQLKVLQLAEAWSELQELLDQQALTDPHIQNKLSYQIMYAWVCMNQGRFDPVDHLMERLFDDFVELPDVLFLKAMALKYRGSLIEAAQFLNEIAFIAPECWEVQYLLADMHKDLQHQDKAIKAYNFVQRRLMQNFEPSTTLHYIYLALPAQDILLLAKRQLSALAKTTR